MNPAEIRQIILSKIPPGTVIPRHTDEGHFYEVVPVGKVFKSVTTRLQVLKDESLTNYKMNRALDYMFAQYKNFTDANIMEHIDIASQQSGGILKDAGEIGTAVHDYRNKYYDDWIRTGQRPKDILSYIPLSNPDVRAISALRALDKFINEWDYIPVVCELLVYDIEYEIAGTLDDIGLMRRVMKPGTIGCEHSIIHIHGKNSWRCMKCDYRHVYDLVLKDLKTSNQFKDHYFFQVALYYKMFKKLTGLKVKKCFILKVSKEDGSYKIEELFQINKLVKYAEHMLKTNEAIDFIKSVRKDNQKKVITIS